MLLDSGVQSGLPWGHRARPRVGGRKDLEEPPAISRPHWQAAHLFDTCVFRRAFHMPGKGSLHPWPTARPRLENVCSCQKAAFGLKRQICFPTAEANNPFLGWAQVTQVFHRLSFQNPSEKSCMSAGEGLPAKGLSPCPAAQKEIRPSWASVPTLQGPGERTPLFPCTPMPTKSPLLA